MNFTALICWSKLSTLAAFLDENSNEMLPIPANKNILPSIEVILQILNRPSLQNQ